MDLTYMEYMTAVLPINLPKLMIRHMSYVISVPQHELSYGELLTRVFEANKVPLNDKEGEPKRTNFFEETFLNMSQLKREDGVWWLSMRANRRRDEDKIAPAENVENEGREQVEEEAQTEGEREKEAESESGEKFYDAMDDERSVDMDVTIPDATVPVAPVQVSAQQKGKTEVTGVDPSGPSGHLPDFELIHLQAKFARALQANARFQELYKQMQSNPSTSPKPQESP
ncbi:hypothetical protein Dimus_001485 [Dionaea muscipula]